MQSLSEFLLHTTDAGFQYASTVGGPYRNKMPRDTMSLQVCCFGCKVLQVIGQLGRSSKSSGSTNEVGTIVTVNVLRSSVQSMCTALVLIQTKRQA